MGIAKGFIDCKRACAADPSRARDIPMNMWMDFTHGLANNRVDEGARHGGASRFGRRRRRGDLRFKDQDWSDNSYSTT